MKSGILAVELNQFNQPFRLFPRASSIVHADSISSDRLYAINNHPSNNFQIYYTTIQLKIHNADQGFESLIMHLSTVVVSFFHMLH